MAKNKELTDAVVLEEVAVPDVEETPVIPVISVQAPKKVFSFEQWANLRKKPVRHLGGMRAFLGNESGFKYTLEVWDEKMKAY